MKHHKPHHLRAALGILALVLHPCQILASPIAFFDGEFDQTNWTIVTQTIVNGGTVVAAQVGAGGNPDAFREIQNTVNGGNGSAIYGIHMNTAATYDPSVSGAVATVDYSEDSILFVGAGDGQATSPAILQAGDYFFLQWDLFLYANQSVWTPQSLTELTPIDFRTLLDASSHPDFSTDGAQITFGFVRANSTRDFGYSNQAGIDNWSVSLHTETIPIPSPIGLVALPLSLFLFISRRRLPRQDSRATSGIA
jgi:hypothetical protein